MELDALTTTIIIQVLSVLFFGVAFGWISRGYYERRERKKTQHERDLRRIREIANPTSRIDREEAGKIRSET